EIIVIWPPLSSNNRIPSGFRQARLVPWHFATCLRPGASGQWRLCNPRPECPPAMSENHSVILSAFADEAANQKTAVQQFSALAAIGLEYYSLRFVDVGNGIKNV